jgi:hypothetical protein
MSTGWMFWIALAVMGVGLIGAVLPLVPGVGLIWLVILAYAIAERFASIDPITFIFLTVLGAIGFSTDIWMSQVGGKAGGASIWSLLAGLITGLIGALIGFFFLGVGLVPGAALGALIGVVLAEWYRHDDWEKAFKAGGGWLIGCLISDGIQFLIGIWMILIFVWQVLRG